MTETFLRLGRCYSITLYAIDSDEPPQTPAQMHAWNSHADSVDWPANIDVDEFVFPTKQTADVIGLNPKLARPDAWHHDCDRDACDEGVSWRHMIAPKLKIRELQNASSMPLAAGWRAAP